MTEFDTRKTLLLRIRDTADADAWNEFVELYTPLIYHYILKHGLQAADASDVVQEVLKTVARAIQNFEYDQSKGLFRGWLYTVTRSKMNNHFKKQSRTPQGTGGTEDLDRLPGNEDRDGWDLEYRRHIFQWAAAQVKDEFTDQTWQAFWQTAVEERKPAQVAVRLDISVGAVYIARSRVIARLKSMVAGISGEDEPFIVSA